MDSNSQPYLVKQQEEGLTIGAHSTPDIDLILQIQQEMKNLQAHQMSTQYKV